MKEALYLEDSYKKEFTATVTDVRDGRFVFLDQTLFYPNGGGQPNDTGKFIDQGNKEYNVMFVVKSEGRISHEVDSIGLRPGDKIKGIINWERRYKHMRAHTSAHIVSGIINKRTGALITGNQLAEDKIRIDFNLDDFDPELLRRFIDEANELIKKDLKITTRIIAREEAEKDGSLFKLAKSLPESIREIRIVSIGDFDSQADAGTHVNSTKEIGTLEFLKAENKGKNNRRLYYCLKP